MEVRQAYLSLTRAGIWKRGVTVGFAATRILGVALDRRAWRKTYVARVANVVSFASIVDLPRVARQVLYASKLRNITFYAHIAEKSAILDYWITTLHAECETTGKDPAESFFRAFGFLGRAAAQRDTVAHVAHYVPAHRSAVAVI